MIINIDGLDINYIDEGAGDPVLLIHGWGSSVLPWQPILKGFEGYRTVALDLPGCGQSDILKTDWGIDDYCNFIIKFMTLLKIENPILVGHSHGGRICLKMVGGGMVTPKKLILFDSAGIPAKKTLKKRTKVFCFKFIKRVLSLPVIKNRSAGLLDKARSHFGSSDYKNAPEVMRKTMVRVIGVDVRPLLENITCPTLLIWGDDDTETPLSNAEYMEQHIKDCGLCVIEGGHFAFLQQPYRVIAILKSFLS